MGAGRLLYNRDNLELEILLHNSYHFLHRDYRVPHRCGLALRKTKPNLIDLPGFLLSDFRRKASGRAELTFDSATRFLRTRVRILGSQARSAFPGGRLSRGTRVYGIPPTDR